MMRPPALRPLAAVLLAWIAFGTAAYAQTQTAEALLIERFYRLLLESPAPGLPDEARMQALSTLISPALAERLSQAEKSQTLCVASAQTDEKPLMLEHDLFLGSADTPTEIAYGPFKRSLHSRSQNVRLIAIDHRFSVGDPRRVVTWTSEVILRRAGADWRIDDVRFSQGPSLRAELLEYITMARRSCRPARRTR